MRRWVASIGVLAACGGRAQPSSHLAAAGAVADDGTGQLARASVRMSIDSIGVAADDDKPVAITRPASSTTSSAFGGALYGGGVARVSLTPVNRTVPYAVASIGGAGAVTGSVTWANSATAHASLQTACGVVEERDAAHRAGADASNVVVYLEGIARGRAVDYIELPVTVGGTMRVAHCALTPTVQVMAPVPAPMTNPR